MRCYFPRQVIHIVLFIICMHAAQSTAQTSPPNRCAGEEARQFDFWIGDWDVFEKDGHLAGTNLIVSMYEGCLLHESWKAKGMVGQSFNRYDAARGLWHQTWVDSTGGFLLIEGKFVNGVMTLSDSSLPGKKDPMKINEIAWTKLPDGSVRQHWRGSKDGGATWLTVFDGKYVRSTRTQPNVVGAKMEPELK